MVISPPRPKRSAQPAVPAAPGVVTYAADSFSRTISGGWGTADLGGSYTVDPIPSDFSVDGVMGKMAAAAGASSKLAELPGVSARDVDMLLRLQTDRLAIGGDQYAYLTIRRVSGGNEYRGQVRLTPSGQVGLQIRKTVGWTETAVAPEGLVPGLSHVANGFIWVRMQVVGSPTAALRMKAWAAGQPEPVGWQTEAADSTVPLQGPGDVGLRVYVGSSSTAGTVTFGVDDLLVTSPNGTLGQSQSIALPVQQPADPTPTGAELAPNEQPTRSAGLVYIPFTVLSLPNG